MFSKLLLAFITIPLLEILILIKMGEVVGFWNTVLTVIVTGFAGALLARIEGMRTYQAIQAELQAGRMPAEKMIDAFILLSAGILLISPGLLTDIAGIILLIPVTRFWLKRWLRKKFDAYLRASQAGESRSFQFFIR